MPQNCITAPKQKVGRIVPGWLDWTWIFFLEKSVWLWTTFFPFRSISLYVSSDSGIPNFSLSIQKAVEWIEAQAHCITSVLTRTAWVPLSKSPGRAKTGWTMTLLLGQNYIHLGCHSGSTACAHCRSRIFPDRCGHHTCLPFHSVHTAWCSAHPSDHPAILEKK